MKFDRLVALLPCQSLEDFDLDGGKRRPSSCSRRGRASGIPRCWPAAEGIPTWAPAASPPPDPAGHLMIVPDCCALVPEDWLSQAEAAGACVLRNLPPARRWWPPPWSASGGLSHSRCGRHLGWPIRANGTVPSAGPRSRSGGRFPGPGLLPPASRTADAQVAVHAATWTKADCGRPHWPRPMRPSRAMRRRPAAHLQSAFDRLHEAREYFYPVEPGCWT